MKILSFLLLILGLTAFAPKPKLTNVKLGSGLTVGVPVGFAPLPDDGIAVKYPSPRKPLAVYSNPSGRVDFSVAVRPTTFESMDYGVLLKIYKSSIQRLYTKVDFIKEDIRTVNGRDFIYFEFVSTVSDTRRTNNQLAPIKRYQTVQYAIQGQQLYVFTFVAPAEEQAQWQPTAQAVMGAISMK
jgi:hypothetical protein